MSNFVDYTDEDIERHNECVRMNAKDRYDRDHMFDDPDYPNPESDEWLEEHCYRCKHNREHEENGRMWAECTSCTCEFEEVEDD